MRKHPGPSHRSSTKRIIRYALWTAVVLICVLSIYSAYGGYVRPSHTLIGKTAPLAVMAFPAMALLLVIMTLVLALFRLRMAYVGLLAICICAPSLWNICPVNIGKDATASLQAYQSFKLLTFNVMNLSDFDKSHSKDANNRIMSFIIKTDADIVSMQEIIFFPSTRQNSNVESQLDTIQKMYPYRGQATTGAFMVLSKYPIRRIEVQQPLVKKFLPYAAFSIDMPQGPVTLFDCHLESIGLTDSDKASYQDITRGKFNKSDIKDMKHSAIYKLNEAYRIRARQVEQLRQAADSIGGNIIIAGDFNDVPLSYSVKCLKQADFKEAYPSLALGPGFTYHADRLYFRIDHIFYRGNIKPIDLQIPKVNISDHYPVIATFL